MRDYYATLLPECTYHVYNRGVNGDKLFHYAENYRYFLQKLAQYLGEYVDIYAYCLLGNHFHLLLKIKNRDIVTATFRKDIIEHGTLSLRYQSWIEGEDIYITTDEIITERFRSFFISYAKSAAKQTGRKGSLFQRPFKRLLVNDDNYFTRLIYYIHENPTHHNPKIDFRYYEWSSYKRHLIETPTLLRKEFVLDWFYGKEKYIEFHQQLHDSEQIEKYWIDEAEEEM